MCDDATEYARYWAGVTGKQPSEIYVPLALREPATPEPTETVTVHSVHRGREYAIELDVTGPSSDLSTGRVTGTVRSIEDVTPTA